MWEPPEYGADVFEVDVFEVEAENEDDARAFAVQFWLKNHGQNGQSVRDRVGDGKSPYGGLTVEEYPPLPAHLDLEFVDGGSSVWS